LKKGGGTGKAGETTKGGCCRVQTGNPSPGTSNWRNVETGTANEGKENTRGSDLERYVKKFLKYVALVGKP